MACPITLAGIQLSCESSVGGLKTIYLVQSDDVTDVTLNEEGTMISNITLKSPAKWLEYQFRRGTSSFTSTLTADETTGNNFVSSEITLVFTKMETSKRIEVQAMSIGQLAAIVIDSNGKAWYFGKRGLQDDYVSASAGTGQTGTAKSDSNNYTITLSTESEQWPFEIDPTKIDTIIAGA